MSQRPLRRAGVEVFEELCAAVRAAGVEEMGRREIVDALASVGRLRAALDAFDVRAATALDALDDDGARPSTAMRSATRSSQRAADRRARRSERLRAMPASRAALSDGRINAEHADALGAAAERISPERVEASDLLGKAERRPADLFARDVREWVAAEERAEDREAAERAAEKRQRRRRAARRASCFENEAGMTVLYAEFDPVTGAELRRSLDAEVERLYRLDGGRERAADVRTAEQRRADALFDLITGARSGGVTPPKRHQLVVTATLDAETGAISDGVIPGVGPIPESELERLACSSDLIGMMFSGAGQPLWMGRSSRLVTPAQWTGLVVRDGGCRGCDTDPSRCEAHHIVAWAPPGCGPTDIENLVLLCGHCHHLVHDQGWMLEWRDGGWSLSPPAGWRAA